MISLDNYIVNINCPNCNFFNRIKLKQVRINDVIICRGCKKNIQLKDHFYSTKKAIRSLQRTIKEIENQLSQINKITLNF